MVGVDAESLEIKHAQSLHHLAGARPGLELVPGPLGAGGPLEDNLQFLEKGLFVIVRWSCLAPPFRHQIFLGSQGSEHGKQFVGVGLGSENELAR